MKNKNTIKIVVFSLLFLAAVMPAFSLADDSARIVYTPMEAIPGFGYPSEFPAYIISIFKFGIWIAGISAVIMIMVGGYIYMTSAGNNAQMEKAKRIITDAILGLILALTSWLLLYIINPHLTQIEEFRDPIDPKVLDDLREKINLKKIEGDDYYNISAQKGMLIDFSEAENYEEIKNTVESYRKPEESQKASTDWYFSQRDPHWAYATLGRSTTTIGTYGCAVTSLSMVFKKHGINTDPGSMARQPIFNGDLIVWPESWGNLKRVSSTAHGNIDWSAVDKQIEDGNPVIIFIRTSTSKAGHYVVVTGKGDSGDYVVHDPYWGANRLLGASEASVEGLYGGKAFVDQMIIYNEK